ncbi:hypothetical protein [Azohydromonas sediminis]|uniref:hypothetical protein n=1 Tax=Azohydromonas sediminis TaxID=2259674 RepID=UPI003AF3C821
MTHPVLAAMQRDAAEFVAIRRQIRRHPELAFDERRTAALVADHLEAWGYAVECGVGGTGVVGVLRWGTSPRRPGLRADMDVLPIDRPATGRGRASARA